MIELGKIQKLQILRETTVGLFLNSKYEPSEEDVLLPKNQMPENFEKGEEIEVFIYRDSEDRIIATGKTPKITLGEVALLRVIDKNNVGAFLDWGLEKDLFMPFKEQIDELFVAEKYLVGLYIDKSDRLCATMNISSMLSSESPYTKNQIAKGTVYSINEEIGVFVAVDNKYDSLIPKKELYGNYRIGDEVEVRIKLVKQNGKLELSIRKEIAQQMDVDGKIILDKLDSNNGKLMLCDKSDPNQIKFQLNMSKSSFKRAIGRLFKEGKIKINENSIESIK